MRRLTLFLIFLLLAGAAAGLGYGFAKGKLEDVPPVLQLTEPRINLGRISSGHGTETAETILKLGRTTRFQLTVADPDSGLRELKISVTQNHKQITVLREEWDQGAEPVKSFDVDMVINAQDLGLAQGPAVLLVEARDRSWRRWMRGN
ncbi:MAG: hypothetical protein LBJ14_07040 [Desulfarculales bacterium]|jgi:hypothetical protein|nr:hypothetical protein [Desulfarculales bacterium]